MTGTTTSTRRVQPYGPSDHLGGNPSDQRSVPAAGNLQGSKATTDAEAKKKIQALKNRLDSGKISRRLPELLRKSEDGAQRRRYGLSLRVGDARRPHHLRRRHQAEGRPDHRHPASARWPGPRRPPAMPSTSCSRSSPPANATSAIPACSRPSASNCTTAAPNCSRPPTWGDAPRSGQGGELLRRRDTQVRQVAPKAKARPRSYPLASVKGRHSARRAESL